jgi:hypothetical protein
MSDIEKDYTIKTNSPKNISLELGDIIQLLSPTNSVLNEKIFLINYIDYSILKLIDIENFNTISLEINKETGSFTDESITGIVIINKAEEKGYARQNKLLPNTWVNISFGGDLPTIITGKITDLEEDSIEVTTYPEKDVIYIDFGYKGIPLDIPVVSIVIRDQPKTVDKTDTDTDIDAERAVVVDADETVGIIYTDEGLKPDRDVDAGVDAGVDDDW